MSTPPDPNGGKPASDTLINDRPLIDDEEDARVPYKSDEATAVNHPISGEDDYDTDRTIPGASLYSDPVSTQRAEISGKNAAAPVPASSGPVRRAPAPPTLVHDKAPIDDDDEDAEVTDDGATERLPAPGPSTTAVPRDTQVGPLPDRSPGASLLAGAPAPSPTSGPAVQQWRVVPAGQTSPPPPQPASEPKKPRGLQTVLWSMKPLDDDEENEVAEAESAAPYTPAGGTVARAAQTYIMEAMDMMDGLREFSSDLDDERGRELLSNLTGCTDRLRRALALLATTAAADDE